uniref:Uncharacterized protein LOC102804878 n=1 Tax=Saccoglossus kowalevskii TaxID=10224 RepID=A0ABM0M0P9_SACKO|nr:PREDICTED: uncharacterized protein LOC102804878 [Saccoglossus kowalevskii]
MSLGTSSKHESTEEEDTRALCQQRGVAANAPLSRILQAIDEELKYLKETGQSAKADYVQTLYILKSKQATQDGKVAQAASNEETPLGQAYLKYMDAVSLSQNNAVYNVHAGRLLLLQGKVNEALERLEVAVGVKPTMTIARFYLDWPLQVSLLVLVQV